MPIRFEVEEELNLQLVPITIELPGCRRKRGRPEKAHLESRWTPHQRAASRAQKVKKCLFILRQTTSTKWGKLSRSICLISIHFFFGVSAPVIYIFLEYSHMPRQHLSNTCIGSISPDSNLTCCTVYPHEQIIVFKNSP